MLNHPFLNPTIQLRLRNRRRVRIEIPRKQKARRGLPANSVCSLRFAACCLKVYSLQSAVFPPLSSVFKSRAACTYSPIPLSQSNRAISKKVTGSCKARYVMPEWLLLASAGRAQTSGQAASLSLSVKSSVSPPSSPLRAFASSCAPFPAL